MSLSYAEQLSGIQRTHKFAVSLERAYDYAREGDHYQVSLEHLLLALTEDSEATAVLAACHVDIDRLRTDVAGYLGRLTDRGNGGSDPVAGPILLRTIKHAEAAAKQSGRAQLNGAIVLAAIVGEGTSDAADLLTGQGLTFQLALQALQATHAGTAAPPVGDDKATSAPAPAQPAAPQPQSQPQPQPQPQSEPQPKTQAAPETATQAVPESVTPAQVSKPAATSVATDAPAPAELKAPHRQGDSMQPDVTAPPVAAERAEIQSTEDVLATVRQRIEAKRASQAQSHAATQPPASNQPSLKAEPGLRQAPERETAAPVPAQAQATARPPVEAPSTEAPSTQAVSTEPPPTSVTASPPMPAAEPQRPAEAPQAIAPAPVPEPPIRSITQPPPQVTNPAPKPNAPVVGTTPLPTPAELARKWERAIDGASVGQKEGLGAGTGTGQESALNGGPVAEPASIQREQTQRRQTTGPQTDRAVSTDRQPQEGAQPVPPRSSEPAAASSGGPPSPAPATTAAGYTGSYPEAGQMAPARFDKSSAAPIEPWPDQTMSQAPSGASHHPATGARPGERPANGHPVAAGAPAAPPAHRPPPTYAPPNGAPATPAATTAPAAQRDMPQSATTPPNGSPAIAPHQHRAPMPVGVIPPGRGPGAQSAATPPGARDGAETPAAHQQTDARTPGAPPLQRAPQQGRQPSRRSGKGANGQIQTAAGQLLETIPRVMRVAVPVTVEARIARNDVEGIADGMQGQVAPQRHDLVVTKAMSVRLRAPNGGFWIETASPETQWIENRLGVLQDDFASWRWTVTPQRRGTSKLQLVISARTVGTDGLAAETQLPEQVITVKVRTNYNRAFKKFGGWAIAALAGGAISALGGQLLATGGLRSLLGLIGL